MTILEMLHPALRRRPRGAIPWLRGGWPVIGHLAAMHRDMRGVLAEAEARLGPVFWMDFGFGLDFVACMHPDGVAILKNRSTSSTHYQKNVGALLGDSLIVHDGPKHLHMRSAMNGPFTPKGLSADDVGPIIAETVEARVRSWAGRRELAILTATRELALDVIFRMIGIGERDLPAWRRRYEVFVLAGINFPLRFPGSPRWRAERAQRWLDERLRAAIVAARRGTSGAGLLGQLVATRDDAGEPLSDHELVENTRLLSLAGHETSATAMAWLAIELARDPARWERLCDEAHAAGGVPRTPKDLKAFPFAEALFREVVRLHPPVSTSSRVVTGPLELCGYEIPIGAEVGISIDRLSRHEMLYDAPDTFRPERWLDKREAVTAIELVQFGGGPHFCLGYHVAWLEVVAFAVSLARALRPLGLRPLLEGPYPATHFLPLAHPHPKTKVRFG